MMLTDRLPEHGGTRATESSASPFTPFPSNHRLLQSSQETHHGIAALIAEVQSFTVIAVGLMIGLGALGAALGFAIMGGKFLESARPPAGADPDAAGPHVHRRRPDRRRVPSSASPSPAAAVRQPAAGRCRALLLAADPANARSGASARRHAGGGMRRRGGAINASTAGHDMDTNLTLVGQGICVLRGPDLVHPIKFIWPPLMRGHRRAPAEDRRRPRRCRQRSRRTWRRRRTRSTKRSRHARGKANEIIEQAHQRANQIDRRRQERSHRRRQPPEGVWPTPKSIAAANRAKEDLRKQVSALAVSRCREAAQARDRRQRPQGAARRAGGAAVTEIRR